MKIEITLTEDGLSINSNIQTPLLLLGILEEAKKVLISNMPQQPEPASNNTLDEQPAD